MELYEPLDEFSKWEEDIDDHASILVPVDDSLDNKFEYMAAEIPRYDQQPSKPDKVMSDGFNCIIKAKKRLAQNREAARRSRLRKKAYLQQLESSRLKLAQLEQELNRTRQQLSNNGSFGLSRGVAVFEMEYRNWVEEQHRKLNELRTALQSDISDHDLRALVDSSLKHYYNLFCLKEDAAKADVFFLMSGTWRSSAERFFLWIGGFRPSDILNQVVIPQIEQLTDQQVIDVCNLRQSSQQTEDALSQGMEKLQQTLSEEVAANLQLGYIDESLVVAAMDKLEALENFVNQADHLRQRIMLQMSRVLTTRQAARALLALGEYFQRLRALSSLWAARPSS